MSDFKTDELLPCQCGFKPDHYSIYYSRTPYDVWCPNCEKQLTFAKCKVTGHHSHAIDYWNNHLRILTKEQFNKEIDEFFKEQKKNTGYDGYDHYNYFWESGKGEVLYARCGKY